MAENKPSPSPKPSPNPSPKPSPSPNDGAPAAQAGAMLQALRQAGYTLETERDVQLGGLAYNAARLVDVALRTESLHAGRPSAKPGRNDPCPCGSGKKYKKCCLQDGVDPSARALERAPEGAPPSPKHIPNLSDPSAAQRDLKLFEGMLDRLPELKEVRFPRADALRFLTLRRKETSKVADAELDGFLDEVAQRYLREAAGDGSLDRMRGELLRAAARVRTVDERRSLAAAVVYSLLGKTRGGAGSDPPNPLVCLIFRLSVTEEIKRRARAAGAATAGHKAPGAQGGRAQGTGAALPGTNGYARLSPEVAEGLMQSGERMLAELEHAIVEDRFPVHLPSASLLPVLVHIEQRDRAGHSLSDAELRQLVARVTAAWGDEDRALFAHALDGWLADNSGAPAEAIGLVRSVRALLQAQCADPLDDELVLASLRRRVSSSLQGEPALPLSREATLSAAALERHGDFLLDKGYRELARRTYGLCEHLGPMPIEVANKIRRLEGR